LSVNPADQDSPKYKAKFLVLQGDEDVRTLLLWKEDIGKIITGLAIGQGDDRKSMIDGLLKGTPRTLFDVAVTTHATAHRVRRTADANAGAARDAIEAETLEDNMTNAVIELSIRQMMMQLMPRRILAHAKRYLHHNCRSTKVQQATLASRSDIAISRRACRVDD